MSPPTVTTALLAQLLERLDRSPQGVDPAQYRLVANRLAQALDDPLVDLPQLLAQSPAASQVYENLHYEHAGLCRSPLEPAMQAEVLAREVIDRVRTKAAADSPAGDPATGSHGT